jgi:hypothetical protein
MARYNIDPVTLSKLLTRVEELVKYNLTKPPPDPSPDRLQSQIKSLRENPPKHMSQEIINWRIQRYEEQLQRQRKALQALALETTQQETGVTPQCGLRVFLDIVQAVVQQSLYFSLG